VADRIFSGREHALEATYFHQHDARLLQALRESSKLDEIAIAMADKLALDSPDLLLRVRELGVTTGTAPAFLLGPLLQMAWVHGAPGKRVRDVVLRSLVARGVFSSQAYGQLLDWLYERPPEIFFETALEVIRSGLAVLPADEKEQRIKQILTECGNIAIASGSTLAKLLRLARPFPDDATSALLTIGTALRNTGFRKVTTL